MAVALASPTGRALCGCFSSLRWRCVWTIECSANGHSCFFLLVRLVHMPICLSGYVSAYPPICQAFQTEKEREGERESMRESQRAVSDVPSPEDSSPAEVGLARGVGYSILLNLSLLAVDNLLLCVVSSCA